MFAPKIAKTQSSSGEGLTGQLAHKASTVKGDMQQRAPGVSAPAHEAEPRASRNFSKLSLFPTDHKGRIDGRSLFHGTRVPGVIQTKLQVNEPGDMYEQEAEEVADQVMRMPVERVSPQAHAAHAAGPSRIGPHIATDPQPASRTMGRQAIQAAAPPSQAVCNSLEVSAPLAAQQCADVSEGLAISSPGSAPRGARVIGVRPSQVWVTQPGDAAEIEADRLADLIAPRPSAGLVAQPSPFSYAPPLVWHAIAAPGRPLTGDECQVGLGLGIDLSAVRVHTGPSAAESARVLAAGGYSVGDHVVLGADVSLESAAGRRLIAHELAHVAAERKRGTARLTVARGPTPSAASEPAGAGVEKDVVLALGAFNRTYTLPSGSVFFGAAVESLRDEAQRAAGLPAIVMFDMTEAQQEAWARLAPSGLASGTLIQDALQAGGGTLRGPGRVPYKIRAIYFNNADVGLMDLYPPGTPASVAELNPEGTAQSAAEYRGIVTALGAGNHSVDIYIQHPGGLSKVPAGQQVVVGAPLPAELLAHLPPSFGRPPVKPPAGGTPGTLEPAGGGVAPKTEPTDVGTVKTAEVVGPSGGGGGGQTGEEISPHAFESSAAEGQQATAGAVGGAGGMIQQGSVEHLQNIQNQKAEDDLTSREQQIRRLNRQGLWVAVTLYFDAPKATNLTKDVFPEQSDVQNFLYSTVQTGETKAEALGEQPTTMKPTPPDVPDYAVPQGRQAYKPLGADRMYVTDVKVFPPDPHRKWVGSYTPIYVGQDYCVEGFSEMVATKGTHDRMIADEVMSRRLKFHAGSAAVPHSVVEMWGLDASMASVGHFETLEVSGNDPWDGRVSAKFFGAIGGLCTQITSTYDMRLGLNCDLIEQVSGVRWEWATRKRLYGWKAVVGWNQNDDDG
jgi:hypothetical protein